MNRRSFTPFFYILPSVILLLTFIAYPFAYSVTNSFYSWSWAHPEKGRVFVGFENYVSLLSDPDFQNSLMRTFLFTGYVLCVEFPIGFGLALLLARPLKGIGMIRTLCVVPLIISRVAASLIWQMMYHERLGFLNYFLTLFGVTPVSWLSDPKIALFSCSMVSIWLHIPFEALVLLAGLTGIPSELYESAKLDGASRLRAFAHITLPLLRPVIAILLLIRTMDALREFDIIYVLTFGGPGGATEVISYYGYRSMFSYLKVGYSSAISVFTLILLLVVGIPYIKSIRSQR